MLFALALFTTVHASPLTVLDRTCMFMLGKLSGRVERAHPALANLSDERFLREWRDSTELTYRGNPDRWWTHGARRWMIPSHVVKGVRPWFGLTIRKCSTEDLRRAEDNLVEVFNGATTAHVGAEVMSHWRSREIIYCIHRDDERKAPVGLFHAWTEVTQATDSPVATFVGRERLYQRVSSAQWKQLTEERTQITVTGY